MARKPAAPANEGTIKLVMHGLTVRPCNDFSIEGSFVRIVTDDGDLLMPSATVIAFADPESGGFYAFANSDYTESMAVTAITSGPAGVMCQRDDVAFCHVPPTMLGRLVVSGSPEIFEDDAPAGDADGAVDPDPAPAPEEPRRRRRVAR
jgi:hypothetical protein